MAKRDPVKTDKTAAPQKDAAAERPRGRLKRAVARTAPKIARELGGPRAEAVETATADQLIALNRADKDFQIALRAAAVEELQIDAGDRASARDRQAEMDDWTPSVLGALIIAGFFLTLGVMVARRRPEGTEAEFSIMLGALATMTAAVVNYFFGSSAGSREKTKLLSQTAKSVE